MTDTDILWWYDDPVTELGINVPDWIEQDITPCDIAAIVQGGCASGAYMPAVTYYQARVTMDEYGDEVLEYIEESLGELPTPPTGESWSGLAVYYLSIAVELWASSIEEEIAELLSEGEED